MGDISASNDLHGRSAFKGPTVDHEAGTDYLSRVGMLPLFSLRVGYICIYIYNIYQVYIYIYIYLPATASSFFFRGNYLNGERDEFEAVKLRCDF